MSFVFAGHYFLWLSKLVQACSFKELVLNICDFKLHDILSVPAYWIKKFAV